MHIYIYIHTYIYIYMYTHIHIAVVRRDGGDREPRRRRGPPGRRRL